MRENSSQEDRYMTRSADAAVLTRLELAMIRAVEAFSRWCHFLHQGISGGSLSAQDVWLLHSIRMRAGPQSLSELVLFLNRNDVSSIQYSLKKLEQHGLVERTHGSSKREAGYSLTEQGEQVTGEYGDLREAHLVKLLEDYRAIEASMAEAALTLERMTGLYDQATQTILNRKILGGNNNSRG